MKKITVLFLMWVMLAGACYAFYVANERMEQTAFEYGLDVAEGVQE